MKNFKDYEWELDQIWKAVDYYENAADNSGNTYDEDKFLKMANKLRSRAEELRLEMSANHWRVNV